MNKGSYQDYKMEKQMHVANKQKAVQHKAIILQLLCLSNCIVRYREITDMITALEAQMEYDVLFLKLLQ